MSNKKKPKFTKADSKPVKCLCVHGSCRDGESSCSKCFDGWRGKLCDIPVKDPKNINKHNTKEDDVDSEIFGSSTKRSKNKESQSNQSSYSGSSSNSGSKMSSGYTDYSNEYSFGPGPQTSKPHNSAIDSSSNSSAINTSWFGSSTSTSDSKSKSTSWYQWIKDILYNLVLIISLIFVFAVIGLIVIKHLSRYNRDLQQYLPLDMQDDIENNQGSKN